MLIKKLRTFVLLASLSLLAGCGSDGPKPPEKLPTVPVTGTITLNGKPLAETSISLHHAEGKVAPRGLSDKSGNFSISTYGNNDGAPAGTYKVTAAKSMVKEISPGVLAPPPPGGFKSDIPAKYENLDSTTIQVEIQANQKNELKIDLK